MSDSNKFHDNVFYKHQDGMDAFIRVNRVVMDTGEKAILYAAWAIQGTSGWGFAPVEEVRLDIKPEHYKKWVQYEPKED